MLPSSSGHQISEGVRFIPSESIKKERSATMRTRLHWEREIWGIKGSPAAAVQAGQPQPRIPTPSLTGTGFLQWIFEILIRERGISPLCSKLRLITVENGSRQGFFWEDPALLRGLNWNRSAISCCDVLSRILFDTQAEERRERCLEELQISSEMCLGA